MYAWIVITGGLFAFFAAAGIGANDAANAFATSVGSKALTIKQAVVLAAVFETSGAILMGSHVADTIRKGIADYQCFEDDAYMMMYGCMWVIFSVGIWLFLASYLEMPVSTTHSCVGGMIGMTMALKGWDCVIWYKDIDTFPYVGGVGGIVMSWFLSPVFSGLISSCIFYTIRSTVLRHNFKSKRINWSYPLLIGSTITINTFFIIYKGTKGLGLDKTPLDVACIVSFLTGGCFAMLTVPYIPKMKKWVSQQLHETTQPEQIEMHIPNEKELNKVVSIHNNAEKFDPKNEEMFKYLQVFTAVCDAFSHGANDVANAIGPFAAIYTIYQSNGDISKKSYMEDDAYWILAMGGIGIAFGLYVYGKKITYAIGEKLVKITPSRGVAIELSSALVIITGSRLKIPLSTTHCQVGATIGVGLLERGGTKSVNCRILFKTIIGWVVTCVIVGTFTGLLVSQGAYSPCFQ